MGSFNFYINVDQCLNMSSFDMFFYKLQSEDKFHLSNVQFGDDKGEQSLDKAFYDIKSHIDKYPFLIHDFRLIFGIRSEAQEEKGWKTSVLYRLLKIYYGLMDAHIFIKSKDMVDKNVSVIMLHETNFTFDKENVTKENYDASGDVKLLMEYLGIDWKKDCASSKIAARMQEILDQQQEKDELTVRFLECYLRWLEKLAPEEDECFQQKDYDDYDKIQIPEIERPGRRKTKQEEEGASAMYTSLNYLFDYLDYCVGHYCVFQKEINKNNMAQNMLALLSIVDYITSDLKPQECEGEFKTNDSLMRESKKNWENSTNDAGIKKRYGVMLSHYKEDLNIALRGMQDREKLFEEGKAAHAYKSPERLIGSEGLRPQEKSQYQSGFRAILKGFLKGSVHTKTALEQWNKAYGELKEKLGHMEEELEAYAVDLSEKYKEELEERRQEKIQRSDEQEYSQDMVAKQLEEQKRMKEEILGELKKPQMNPSLSFQDQLNMEAALEQCNLEVRFFVKCFEMIKLMNFVLLLLCGGGVFLAHYILMQTYLFADVQMISAFLIYLGATFGGFVLCWRAPYYYFRKKIKNSMARLEEQMDLYIQGYFDKAKMFQDYINAMNQLDAIDSYMEELKEILNITGLKARVYLWHKVQIQEHLRKVGYFDGLIETMELSEVYRDHEKVCSLDESKDVIHNPLYWPQRRREETND